MDSRLSPWIRWPGYLAWTFLALIPIGVLTVRGGSWKQGLLLYALACLLSLVVLGTLGLISVLPRFAQHRGAALLRAIPAIPGSVLLIVALSGQDVPPIHDITTDTDDPPRFEAVQELREEGSNPLDIDEEVIAQQRAAYPDLETLESARNYRDSYALALETARDLGWEIVRDDPNAGFIEAVDRTTIMGFKDDVVIRVRTGEDTVLVDLRSASRVGVSDIGANAERIRSFAERFREAVAI